jgi:hypothetical protein
MTGGLSNSQIAFDGKATADRQSRCGGMSIVKGLSTQPSGVRWNFESDG